ncbi:MAG TPA: hypothetical protein VK492_07020 [Chitinophagaceae bacterium]|nr:hypothetical protein [Chitinophagaceae bacterium]
MTIVHIPIYLLSAIIFFLILLFNWFGFKFKKWHLEKYPGRVPEDLGAVEGSMLGVMALLLGFTFSIAISKFETRRQITVDEANEIGTAILRCDMYPDSVRNPLRADFKEYIETRIAYYAVGDDEEKIKQEIKNAAEISNRIWKRVALQAQNRDNVAITAQMIPAVNDMIDIVTTRDAGRLSRVPRLVLMVLLGLVLISAFVLGSDYNGKKRNRILILGYAMAMTLTLTLIVELDRPREGLINLHAVEQKMIDLRELVK